jgi:hypothetical protein
VPSAEVIVSKLPLRWLLLLSLVGVTDIVATLKPRLHQDFNSDSKVPIRQGIASHHFSQIFMGHSSWFIGVGYGQ